MWEGTSALVPDPLVSGQAFRVKYIDAALAYIAAHQDVWLTTTDEIAEHYTLRAVATESSIASRSRSRVASISGDASSGP